MCGLTSLITEFFVEPVSVTTAPFFSDVEIKLATVFIEPTGIESITKSASLIAS